MSIYCQRCHRDDEFIPTFQFVKFDDAVHYLCSDCWQHFRRWFFQGWRIETEDRGTR